ncbi:Hsp20 family protein [Plectonema radiosum]|uniref:Hsp20 family protein n=1 Tax=Plectonema radiosum TaxID=945768 RepID=UPI0035C8CFCD
MGDGGSGRKYHVFTFPITLPVAIENNKVQAQFKDGILTLALPKVTSGQPI